MASNIYFESTENLQDIRLINYNYTCTDNIHTLRSHSDRITVCNTSTISDSDLPAGLTTGASITLHLLHQVISRHNLSEDDMFPIQPRSEDYCDEELGTICIPSRVSHRQETNLVVLQREVFVIEFVSVDGLTTSSISSDEVTSLQHELRDHSVEL